MDRLIRIYNTIIVMIIHIFIKCLFIRIESYYGGPAQKLRFIPGKSYDKVSGFIFLSKDQDFKGAIIHPIIKNVKDAKLANVINRKVQTQVKRSRRWGNDL